ncbi:sulfatase family protein [Stieleria varia]|uniref:Choline-sulfatase n=1 Tax=Stieleria varia TaxID=2528005 RepID=A0A5C5ZVD7_9BACT|nr:sulfatase-like hydrolase/transferase [Stieleria varia]TWT91512.1 Choline-sulfatase [Stieleria varia]
MKILASVMLLSIVAIALGSVGTAYSQTPNVVMIVADDQCYRDFGFMGNTRVHTPNLDQLAANSARFPHGYVPSSVCRPSLVSMLTGRYPHEHGVHFNHPPPGFSRLTKSEEIDKAEFDRLRARADKYIQHAATIPRVLGVHGYRSLQTGKYWEGHFRNAGFTQGMTTTEPSGGKYGDKQLANGDWVAHGNGDHGLSIGRETMQPIERFVDSDDRRPFFLWYAPFLPHVPHDSPQKYFDIAKGYDGVDPHELPYFAAIAQFDDTVGQLMEILRRADKLQSTLIVFVSDNGWVPEPGKSLKPIQGESAIPQWDHTRSSKRAPFDDGLRTPILFCWPGHIQPATFSTPVSSVDLMPTILAAARVDTAGLQLSGVNLWNVVQGRENPDPQRCVFGEIYPGDATSLDHPERDVAYRWVRQGEFKLIVPRHRDATRPWGNYLLKPALFNVLTDPDESDNLIDSQRGRQIAAELNRALDHWWP